MTSCEHVTQIDLSKEPITPEGCQECLAMGDTWVHLRLCRICGHVGCCDLSKNKHATAHFHSTAHPIIQSFEPGEKWGWCYVDQKMLSPRFFADTAPVDAITPLAVATFILLAGIVWLTGLPLWSAFALGLIGAVGTRAIAEWNNRS